MTSLPTYVPIASITTGAATSSITFSAIPSTYTDLVLISQFLSAGSAISSNIVLNGDTATNYSYQRMYGSGTANSADNGINTANSLGSWGIGNSTDVPITFITNIFSYANTNMFKTFITNAMEPNNSTGSNYVGYISSMWRSTSAITSITFQSSGNFGTGSTFNLYGIAAA